jgi:hypothetical protein
LAVSVAKRDDLGRLYPVNPSEVPPDTHFDELLARHLEPPVLPVLGEPSYASALPLMTDVAEHMLDTALRLLATRSESVG